MLFGRRAVHGRGALLPGLGLALILLLLVAGAPRSVAQVADQNALVVDVVEGDTIDVWPFDGSRYRVAISASMLPSQRTRVAVCSAGDRKASARNRELVLDPSVWLERGVSGTDRFGRHAVHSETGN